MQYAGAPAAGGRGGCFKCGGAGHSARDCTARGGGDEATLFVGGLLKSDGTVENDIREHFRALGVPPVIVRCVTSFRVCCCGLSHNVLVFVGVLRAD